MNMAAIPVFTLEKEAVVKEVEVRDHLRLGAVPLERALAGKKTKERDRIVVAVGGGYCLLKPKQAVAAKPQLLKKIVMLGAMYCTAGREQLHSDLSRSIAVCGHAEMWSVGRERAVVVFLTRGLLQHLARQNIQNACRYCGPGNISVCPLFSRQGYNCAKFLSPTHLLNPLPLLLYHQGTPYQQPHLVMWAQRPPPFSSFPC